MKLKDVIQQMDTLTLRITDATARAMNAETGNGAMGAMVAMEGMIADLAALYRVAVLVHREGE